jgi:hypothetical protein
MSNIFPYFFELDVKYRLLQIILDETRIAKEQVHLLVMQSHDIDSHSLVKMDINASKGRPS